MFCMTSPMTKKRLRECSLALSNVDRYCTYAGFECKLAQECCMHFTVFKRRKTRKHSSGNQWKPFTFGSLNSRVARCLRGHSQLMSADISIFKIF